MAIIELNPFAFSLPAPSFGGSLVLDPAIPFAANLNPPRGIEPSPLVPAQSPPSPRVSQPFEPPGWMIPAVGIGGGVADGFAFAGRLFTTGVMPEPRTILPASPMGAAIREALVNISSDPVNNVAWQSLMTAFAHARGLGGMTLNIADGRWGFSGAAGHWSDLAEEARSGWDFWNKQEEGWQDAERFLGSLRARPLRIAREPLPLLHRSKFEFLRDLWHTSPVTPHDGTWEGNTGKRDGDGNQVSSEYRNNLLDMDETPSDGNFDAQETLRGKIEGKRSRAVEYLLNSGTDFINNMFDAMLICHKSEDGFVNFFDELYKSHFLTGGKESDLGFIGGGNIFMVRVSTINIPQAESDVFDVKFGIQTVRKVRSKVKYERKAELRMLLDEPLYFMGVFNMLSNNNRIIFDGISPDRMLPHGFAAFSSGSIVRESLKNKKVRIDLVVKHQKLMRNLQIENLISNPDIYGWRYSRNRNVIGMAGLRSKELPLWWFEDVKFLGQGDGLNFDRDNPNTVDMGFPFLFKRCIKIDRQYRFGTNQTEQFAGRGGGDNEGDFMTEFSVVDERVLSDFFHMRSNQEWFYGKGDSRD